MPSEKKKIKKFKLAAVEEPAFPAESPVEPSPAPDAAKERPADAQNGPIGEYTTPSQRPRCAACSAAEPQ